MFHARTVRPETAPRPEWLFANTDRVSCLLLNPCTLHVKTKQHRRGAYISGPSALPKTFHTTLSSHDSKSKLRLFSAIGSKCIRRNTKTKTRRKKTGPRWLRNPACVTSCGRLGIVYTQPTSIPVARYNTDKEPHTKRRSKFYQMIRRSNNKSTNYIRRHVAWKFHRNAAVHMLAITCIPNAGNFFFLR
jgi:hypothetical protein